ncbi:MAG: holo-ACP synthase [Firmicutes bacterium]|nr:holo-ACP synthase [Bacillota bacterium]
MGIGIDIIETSRFVGMDKEKMARMFSSREMDYIARKNYAPETLAGLFSAKEAFFKAIGTGISQNTIMDVEVLHQSSGAPYYNIGSKVRDEHKYLSTSKIQLSISNTKELSVSVCIVIPTSIVNF